MDWRAEPTTRPAAQMRPHEPISTAQEPDLGRAKVVESRHQKCPTIKSMLAQSLLLLGLASWLQMALASMGLPDGIENILGFVPSSGFRCERDGYFGDIDNDCRIFHLCQKHTGSGGKVEWRHWTYACGNQTMFNQLTLTCAFVDEAIPCRHASQFQYLNEVIHKPREPFLTDADVTSGVSYYTNRIMSDGARNRAFEDSNLMAQLGGSSFSNNPPPPPQQDGRFVQSNRLGSLNQGPVFQQQNSNLNLNFQQPPPQQQQQQQQQQQGLFFPPSSTTSEQPSSDNSDDSTRTINSIELPDLPLQAAFQSFSRQATAALDSDRQTGRQQDLVLINHSANHQQQQQQQLQLQFFAFPESRFAPEPPAPPAATTTVLPAASSTGASVAAGQQQQQQVNVQQQQPNPPAGFNFAISTDHRLGPSPASALFTSSNSQPQAQQQQLPLLLQQQNQANFQTTVPSLSTASAQAATQVPSLPTTASPTTASFITTTPSASASATQPTAAAAAIPIATTTTAASTTITAATNTNAPTSTSTLGRLAEPTTAASFSAPPTTTTSSSASRAGSAGSAGAAQTARQLSSQRASSSAAAAPRAHPNQRRGAARAASEALLDAHPMRHFQSNRLSSMKRQQPAESAVVMRRQLGALSNQQQPAGSGPAVAAAAGSLPISSIDESEAFWRRPFDVQLMVPRFESLLTRRRV